MNLRVKSCLGASQAFVDIIDPIGPLFLSFLDYRNLSFGMEKKEKGVGWVGFFLCCFPPSPFSVYSLPCPSVIPLW